MNFRLSSFEVKKPEDNTWRKVSEKIAMEKLAECFDPITPTLAKMMEGIEIVAKHEIYRIRP